MENKPLTYSRYLHMDGLLSQQQPLSDEHDELLFIIIHQVYELWFKQLLHELRALRTALQGGDTHRTLALLKRVLTILKTLVSQVDVLETMTPLSFKTFRARLEASSGFQSAQFRAVEFILGHKRPPLLAQYESDPAGHALLASLLTEPDIPAALLDYLSSLGHRVSTAARSRPTSAAHEADAEVQALLVQVYRQGDFPMQVCERLVDLDEGLQEWRYRHVKMVERTIGSLPGSGGSSGADYLRRTLFKPLFPDLWAIRAQL